MAQGSHGSGGSTGRYSGGALYHRPAVPMHPHGAAPGQRWAIFGHRRRAGRTPPGGRPRECPREGACPVSINGLQIQPD